MADTQTHLKVHNIWPLTFGTIFTLATIIFTAGSLHSRFTILENDFKEYKRETDKKIDALYLRSTQSGLGKDSKLVVIDELGQVQGIATDSATISVTPPVIRTPTPTRIPQPTQEEGKE